MIIDRTWNKHTQNYVISYLDENGNRKMWNRYMHHWVTYEHDENGEFETWDGKRCEKVFKNSSDYSPCEFDQLEMLYGLEKTEPQILAEFHASRSPRAYAFDIETKYEEGKFPYPDKAEFEVTALSLVGPDGSCIVYGSHDLNEQQIEDMRKQYFEFIRTNDYARSIIDVDNIKFLYQYFSDEKEMLRHIFLKVFPKISCLTGWNTYNFDFQYLTNRLIVLFGKTEAYSMIKRCSPTNELHMMKVDDGFGNKFQIPTPKHAIWLDEMQLVKDYDYVLRPYENYSLDYVGERAVKANKVKYTEHGLNELLKVNPEKYYFYNAVDSLIVLLIRCRLKCIESPAAVASLTLVPLYKAFGQVALTTANLFQEFYLDNKHVVYKHKNEIKVPYEGAFCACIPGRYELSTCSDFKSLYPSQVRTCNFSPENVVKNIIGPDSLGRYVDAKWGDADLEKFRQDPQYFVSVQGNVYKNDKDYAFKRMMTKLMDGRATYKYTGNDIDAELLPWLDDLIKEKEAS